MATKNTKEVKPVATTAKTNKNGKTAKQDAKPAKTEKVAKSARVSIKDRMFQLFEEKGMENVTVEMAEKEAKKIKPDTQFKPNHLAWYRGKFRQLSK